MHDQNGSCPGTHYPVSDQYSKVCKRVIGYQFGSPGAFSMDVYNPLSIIDEAYVDGISITHVVLRVHIWSSAAGSSEKLMVAAVILSIAHAQLVVAMPHLPMLEQTIIVSPLIARVVI